MSNARTAAVALYTLALASPAAADWQSVATSLFEALPKSKAVADAPVWWSDYAVPKAYTLESVDVTFADGVSFRCNLVSGKNKPPRVAGACRGAIGLYRAKNGCGVAVPAFARIVTAGGQAYDAAECSRLTDELRAIPGTVQGRPMTDARIAWMTSELERRRAGLARSIGGDAFSTAGAGAWAEAVRAAEDELAAMLYAYAVQRGESPPLPSFMARSPIVEEADHIMPDHVYAADYEVVSDALSVAYGECAEFELAGTFEAESGLIPADVVLHSIVVESQSVAAEIVQACEAAPEAADDVWSPSAETHPVIAYCLSHKARETLFARVQDGTFPDDAGSARAGAWRLTLADAEDLRDVGSIRFAGLPRKAYTRRAVEPVAPVSTFVRIPAGAPFMEAGRPATYHAATA